MIRWRIKVEGKVQGVFYRASTQSKAQEIGLSGWVKNQPDGSVLLEAQGQVEVVNELVTWCWKGPMMARVDRVTQEEISIQESSSFDIIR